MKNKYCFLLILLIGVLSGCSDNCQKEPLDKDDLLSLLNILSTDQNPSEFLKKKNYPNSFVSVNNLQLHNNKSIALLPSNEYDISLTSVEENCIGDFQILYVNRKNENQAVGKSIILIYSSGKSFSNQSKLVRKLEGFTPGMGSLNQNKNKIYLQERTSIEFDNFDLVVKAPFIFRKLDEGEDKIQIETFSTHFKDSPDESTYFIAIRVYPKDERWRF